MGDKGEDNLGFDNSLENNHIPKQKDEKKVEVLESKLADIDAIKDTEDGSTERQQWSNPIEFLLSCIAMSVGLGNVWRFPFTAYKNGGGAFLIPYLVVLLLIGRPLYFMELSMGQFSSSGSVKVWNMVPLARGVGFGQVIGTASVVSYYCSLIAIALHYLGASFQTRLPWTYCHPDLAQETEQCKDSAFAPAHGNETIHSNISIVGPAEQYFTRGVLREIPDISGGIGMPGLELSLCLLGCWVLLFLTLWKGVASSGKVAYFTAIFPYVVLITLLVRGLTLPGSMKGVLFYLTPKWEELGNLSVWYAAVTQSFFSLSTGFGALVTYSSYNKFNHNSYRDALIISVADTLTSLLAGFVIFSILGNLAEELGVEINDVVSSGPGLAFISYPTALAKFDYLPQLFSVLFFLMLITLGLGSATGLTSGIIAIICDLKPEWNKTKVTGCVCVVLFLVGLCYTTPGGQAILTLVDHFGGTFVIFILALSEVVAVSWIYGLPRFIRDIKFMINITLGIYWKFCLMGFIPVCLSSILIYVIYKNDPITYQGLDFPPMAIYAGWSLAGVALLQIPLWALWECYKCGGIRKALRPNSEWGPSDKSMRDQWHHQSLELTRL